MTQYANKAEKFPTKPDNALFFLYVDDLTYWDRHTITVCIGLLYILIIYFMAQPNIILGYETRHRKLS